MTAGTSTTGVTRAVAERSAALQLVDIPRDVVEIARQCVLDWVGVTLAGSREPAARLLLETLLEDRAGDRGVTVVGTDVRLLPLEAALVNGTASHALDYDDANLALLGHPTVAVLGALFALAEARHAPGADVLCAFVAGYEAECRVARAVGASHYQQGFHATGTIGTFGAAAACARLLGLDAEQTAVAFGLAAAQAAGLKAMFGTMAKPLHAGKAGANGLLAARLAARGFTANPCAVEAEQGVAAAMACSARPTVDDFDPDDGWFVRSNLFKYHAACYETHSTIEALRDLRERERFSADDATSVVVHANAPQLRVCGIEEPRTGLEAKFSLRHVAALAVLGADTGAIECFTDESTRDRAMVAMRHRVSIAEDGPTRGGTPVEVHLRDGRSLQATYDVSKPSRDLALQWIRLEEKFHRLADAIVGPEVASTVVATARGIDELPDVATALALTRVTRPSRPPDEKR